MADKNAVEDGAIPNTYLLLGLVILLVLGIEGAAPGGEVNGSLPLLVLLFQGGGGCTVNS